MNRYERKQLLYKCILALCFIGCVTAIVIAFTHNKISIKIGSGDKSESIEELSSTLENFKTIIDKYYIGDIDEEKITDETIKGYVKGLDDQYSEYMTADEWDDYQADALGNYVGIGIYLLQEASSEEVVMQPMEGSPALEAGIQDGDIIVEVEGESVVGLNTSEVANKVKGLEGTKVRIKVLRNEEYLDFEVERREIKVHHVTNQMLDDNIGYIKLDTFDEGCSDEFKNALESVKEQGAEKLIVDLRDNTGGLVDEAIDIIDMFVEKGKKVLITVDAKGEKEITKAEEKPIIENMEVVVLANKYSASASEIFIGALKDNEVATIVGQKTYGKGVIQNVFSLTDGSVLKLTTAEYFTPNETKINKVGIEPDVAVDEKDIEEGNDTVLIKGIEVLQK